MWWHGWRKRREGQRSTCIGGCCITTTTLSHYSTAMLKCPRTSMLTSLCKTWWHRVRQNCEEIEQEEMEEKEVEKEEVFLITVPHFFPSVWILMYSASFSIPSHTTSCASGTIWSREELAGCSACQQIQASEWWADWLTDNRYKLHDYLLPVDCRQLIHQTLVSGGKLADQMKPFCKQGLMSEKGWGGRKRKEEGEGGWSYNSFLLAVPDDMVLSVVRKRLEQVDCATRGWVLHGFPLTRDQAELLTTAGYNPNRWGMTGRERRWKWRERDASLLP